MVWTSLIAQGKRRLWMSFLLAVLIALVYLHFARFYQGRVATWVLVLFAVPVLLNLARAGLGLAYGLLRHPFRLLDLGLASDYAVPGKTFEIEIRAEARRDLVLRRLATELRCTQHKSNARGRQLAVIHDEETILESDFPMTDGGRKTYRASLPVPAGAPYSYRSMEGKIRWALHVLVDVEGWGELRDEIEVTVAPGIVHA